jgi:3-methyladenine DNA glycosylase AlkD
MRYDFESKFCIYMSSVKQIVCRLKSLANPKNVEGMARYGINPRGTLGVNIPVLRKMAKEIGKNHSLAMELWETKIHEARLLAGFIAVPAQLTQKQMEKWVKDFDSWDVCDQVCSNLFDKTPFAHQKAKEWSNRKSEFIKRAGFVLMAALSVHNKQASDKDFLPFFALIKKHALDERNFVKKAVNWALRQIGKRNERLRRIAIKTAREIQSQDSRSARWIANDALREFKKIGAK